MIFISKSTMIFIFQAWSYKNRHFCHMTYSSKKSHNFWNVLTYLSSSFAFLFLATILSNRFPLFNFYMYAIISYALCHTMKVLNSSLANDNLSEARLALAWISSAIVWVLNFVCVFYSHQQFSDSIELRWSIPFPFNLVFTSLISYIVLWSAFQKGFFRIIFILCNKFYLIVMNPVYLGQHAISFIPVENICIGTSTDLSNI